ncbi:50S ribosomal protein L17 [Candidatus Daviesbacteria bacterium]|nr:50S ribosomal protein L17 [Candidatus Daviesbacteria bacterium]
MRHRVYGKKLGRNKNEREALFKSLVQLLILHGTIITSESKAKAIKGLVDKVINLAKDKNSQRLLQSYFTNGLLQERLVKEIIPKLNSRVSGYTTTVRIGVREGDRTTLVRMSLIGVEQLKPLKTK